MWGATSFDCTITSQNKHYTAVPWYGHNYAQHTPASYMMSVRVSQHTVFDEKLPQAQYFTQGEMHII